MIFIILKISGQDISKEGSTLNKFRILPYYEIVVRAVQSQFKSRPKFDEGIFESYVHLNIVVLDLLNLMSRSDDQFWSNQ